MYHILSNRLPPDISTPAFSTPCNFDRAAFSTPAFSASPQLDWPLTTAEATKLATVCLRL